MRFSTLVLLAAAALAANAAAAAPTAVATFHSIGLYWSPQGGAESNAARVEFREAGASNGARASTSGSTRATANTAAAWSSSSRARNTR